MRTAAHGFMGFIIKFHSQVFTQKELGKKKKDKRKYFDILSMSSVLKVYTVM